MNFTWLHGLPAGIIVTLIAFLGAGVIIVCNKYIKKITNCYFFWLGLAIAILTYFIACRFAGSWINYANALKNGYIVVDGQQYEFSGSTYEGAQVISRALMFDFCPFFGFLTLILLIVDPSRKAARSVAPIMLLGTIFTCTAGFLTQEKMSLDPFFIFIGPENWELYVTLHWINLWIGVGVLQNTPKFEFEGYLIMLGCVFGFVIYVLVGKTITGCYTATSGLSYADWWYMPSVVPGVDPYPGTYYPITKILGNNPKLAMGLCWPLELALFSGIVALWDCVFKRHKWHFFGNYVKKPKNWIFWYDYTKETKPWRFPWKPLNKVSLFWSKFTKLKTRKKS